MKNIIRIAAAITLVGILLLEFWYVDERIKKDEELRSERKANLNSILSRGTIHLECVRCGYDNSRTMLWLRDSAR